MLPVITVILTVVILVLLNFDEPLKKKINILINLLFINMILLIVIAYLLYPQYQINKNLQDSLQYESQP